MDFTDPWKTGATILVAAWGLRGMARKGAPLVWKVTRPLLRQAKARILREEREQLADHEHRLHDAELLLGAGDRERR